MIWRGFPLRITALALLLSLQFAADVTSAADPAAQAPAHAVATTPDPATVTVPARVDYYDFHRMNLLAHLPQQAPIAPEPPLVDFAGKFVDRAELANVLREQKSLEVLRLWNSSSASLYFGVGPNGLAGINLTQKKKRRRTKSEGPAPDYSKLIATLLDDAP